MEKLSIRIKIADREYPMKVDPEDEERIRNAGRIINEKLKEYREQFGIDDHQDLLAMVAFDSVVDKIKSEADHSTVDQSIHDRISFLNNLVSQAI